jgi:hypothetical protein
LENPPRGPIATDFVLLNRSDAPLLPGIPGAPERPLAADWCRDPGAFRHKLSPLLADAGHILIHWLGAELTGKLTVQIGPPFDFLMPGEADEPAPGTVVPYAVVDHWLESMFMRPQPTMTFETLWEIIAPYAQERKVTFLGPTPLLPTVVLRERLRTHPGLVALEERLQVDLESVPLVNDRVRTKTWQALLTVYRRVAERCQSRFIPPPQDALSRDGTLAPRYWGSDAVHANHEYGRLYLREIVAAVQPAQAEASLS